MTGLHRYHPCYCEENVWWLCQHQGVASFDRWVVFISNAERRCALFQQQAGPAGRAVVWDYHVILVVRGDHQAQAWDLDSRLSLPCGLFDYLAQTFPFGEGAFAPRFRVVEAADFLRSFVTDRSHMRAPDGRWRAPPPPWPAPGAEGQAANLMRFIDMDDTIAGAVVDLPGLVRRFAVVEPSRPSR